MACAAGRLNAAFCVALALVLAGCASAHSSSSAPPAPNPEAALRAQLGIPSETKTVILFGQSSHLDIDWQKTFVDYYSTWVDDILQQAQDMMQKQPRAFYGVAEVAYVEQYVAEHPDALAALRAAAKRGQLHIVGGGLTSPDTLLPETELLIRDYLFGNRFAEQTLGVRPTAAWLPDSFGQSATAPDVLSALGYTSVGFSRIDGAPTLFYQMAHPDAAPPAGSTAARLKQLGSADFIWKGTGGGSVLAHFMVTPGLYCAGDNIDYDEPFEVPHGHIGLFKGGDTSFTDARIDGYIQAIRPYAKTPYMFIPVGCDFQDPKQQLVRYLDGYDQRRYPTTGVWAVAAPFDDYATLVLAHRSALPVVSGSLTPYFTGFYGSRAEIKRGARDAARPFFESETYATALGAEGASVVRAAEPELELLALSDHHDFITGTSVDSVVQDEELPLLAKAEAAGQAELAQIASDVAARIAPASGAFDRVLAFNPSGNTESGVVEAAVPIAQGSAPPLHAVSGGKSIPVELAAAVAPSDTTAALRFELDAMPPFSWRAIDLLPGSAAPAEHKVRLELTDANGAPATGSAVKRVVLSNAHVRAEWDDDGGFALKSLVIDGEELVAANSFLIHDYEDNGGLWRIGSEMKGCDFKPIARASSPDTVDVLESSPLEARVAFEQADATLEVALAAGDAGLSLAITTGAAETTTRTVSFAFKTGSNPTLTTSTPGGYAARQAQRVYTPTFWPAVAWARVGDAAILLRQSTGVSMSTPGHVELMAARDSRSDQCELQGASGSDVGTHRIEWRIERATSPAAAATAAQAFNRPLVVEPVRTASASNQPPLPDQMSLLQVDGDGIVSAFKPADRGDGVILRALLLPGPVTVHLPASWVGKTLIQDDAAERDLKTLGPAPSAITFDAADGGSIATVRLR
jgi:Glycosyl hydrolases family 38 N-terminal domain/Alpha mannosidase middle domain